jgi:predicted Zn-dependent peptidase
MAVSFAKPPEPLAPVPFNIAEPVRKQLDNGLKLVLVHDERIPLVNYRFAFFRGDAHDPKGSTGLTSATAAMMTEGTEQYSSRELAEKIERLGASLNASASNDFTVLSGSSLSVYADDILSLLAEVLFKPTFPESEIDLYRRNAIENLKYHRSQPSFLANEQTARLVYGAHPYAIISPKERDFENLDRQTLVQFHEKLFQPNNAVLIVVGDFDQAEIEKQIDDHFGSWQAENVELPQTEPVPDRTSRTLTIVDRPGSAQANIVLSNIAIRRNHPDHFATTVMNQVLGAGASSRVFMNLREEKGYTYGAYTRLDAKKLAGDFEATAEVRTAVTGDSLKEFFYELNRIRDEAVADQELADAKSFLTGVFPIRAETQEGLTGLISNQVLYGLPEDYLQTYREKIDAITLDDVQRVAKAYIRPDELAMVIVGDAKEITKQAESYAEAIEVLDSEGRSRSA